MLFTELEHSGRLAGFEGAKLCRWGDFIIEAICRDAHRQASVVRAIADDVLEIAAESRGWNTPEERAEFVRHFKIEPLFEARGLALVWQQKRLVGVAGCVNDWQIGNDRLVHLCSLGMRPSVQARGLMPVLMFLLWSTALSDPSLASALSQGRLFVSAITQSAYLMAYLDRLFRLYPAPSHVPDERVRVLADAVVQRFDPHVHFERERLILRNECNFRYASFPRSTSARWNAFCAEQLAVDQGDVFVAIGHADQKKIQDVMANTVRKLPGVQRLVENWADPI